MKSARPISPACLFCLAGLAYALCPYKMFAMFI